MSDQSKKAQLLARIKAERTLWDELIAALDAKQLTAPGVVGQWSIKDMVSHLTAWQSRPVAWLTAIRDGGRPMPAPWSADMTEEQVNAWIRQTNQERPLNAVLAESKSMHEELVRLLESTPDADLTTPERFSWFTAGAMIDRIAGNTYEHYEEHAAQVRKWLESVRVP